MLLYNLPRRVFHTNNRLEESIIGITALFILPYLFYFIARKNKVNKESSEILAYSSILLFFLFLFIIYLEDKKELEIYQKETIGIINKAWRPRSRRSYSDYQVQASYIINGKLYQTTSREDEDRILTYGDTITIIYSSKTPENCKIKELEEYYEE